MAGVNVASNRYSRPEEDKEAEDRDEEENLHAPQQGYQGAKASCTLFHRAREFAQNHA